MKKNTTPKDPYAVVTARIIEALEQGIVPWRKPWRSIAGSGPTSLATGKPYQGVNVWVLSATSHLRGYSSPYWATFKQAKEHAVRSAIAEGREIITETTKRGTFYYELVNGERQPFLGGVRKGEKGTGIVFWKVTEKRDKDTDEVTDRIPFLRYFTVFNLDQTDGVSAPVSEPLPEFDPIERAEAMQAGMPARPEVKHGGDRAYYSPRLDYVQMPLRVAFTSPEHYYATLFHELVHSTGHSSRIGREGVESVTPFGTADYSKEELVAEMGAAFLCGLSGIDAGIEHHASYIAGWLSALQNDRKLLVHAAAAAQKAANYISNRKEEEPAAPPPPRSTLKEERCTSTSTPGRSSLQTTSNYAWTYGTPAGPIGTARASCATSFAFCPPGHRPSFSRVKTSAPRRFSRSTPTRRPPLS